MLILIGKHILQYIVYVYFIHVFIHIIKLHIL